MVKLEDLAVLPRTLEARVNEGRVLVGVRQKLELGGGPRPATVHCRTDLCNPEECAGVRGRWLLLSGDVKHDVFGAHGPDVRARVNTAIQLSPPPPEHDGWRRHSGCVANAQLAIHICDSVTLLHAGDGRNKAKATVAAATS